MDDATKPPPEPKTSVADNAMKITQNLKTGEFGVETGKKVDPNVIEEFTKQLTAKASEAGTKNDGDNVEAQETEKQANAEKQAKKAQ